MTNAEFAQLFIDTIHSIEQRCMAADGPVIPTCEEITDQELRDLYVAARVVVDLPQRAHTGECATDDTARQVCEGIYGDRVKSNLMLCEALRAVYALVGEDKDIKKIVHDAIRQHGIDDA